MPGLGLTSALINEKDQFIEYRFEVTEFIIIMGEEMDEFPVERISDIKIEHFYEEATFPIFKVNALMEASRYYKIIRNKANIKFKVRIQYYYTVTGDKEGERSLYRDYINDTFSLFQDDNNDNYERDLYENLDDSVQEDQLDKLTNHIELFLFKDTYVAGLRGTYNTVLNGVTMCTAAVYLLYKAGVRGALVSPFDNIRSYGSVTLPPQSIDKQLRYLNNNYGFHKKGTIVYFGLQHSYILNCKAGCTAYQKDEWQETVVYVFEKGSGYAALNGPILKFEEEKFYCCVKTDAIDIQSKTVSENVITGTDAVTINMSASRTTRQKATTATTTVKSNEAVIFNNSNNPYLEETFLAQKEANSTVISLSIEHINPEMFNPNKTFSIIFENNVFNEKYKGVYRVATALYTFINTGSSYELSATVVLKRAVA